MESRDNHEPLILTKREFLQGFASVSGISAVVAALDAWGMSIASAATAPPDLSDLTAWQAGAVESAWYQVERLHANAATV